jgi:hypothetical protein
MTGLLPGHLLKLGLVNIPDCDRCRQASEMALHVLGDCEALAILRFRHVGHHFMKLSDFEDIPVYRILHFVQGTGLLTE